MKNNTIFINVLTMLLIIVAVAAIVLIAGGVHPDNERTQEVYPLMAQVVEIEEATDSVVVEDYDGQLWTFYGIEDWKLGDSVNLLMDHQNTETIIDDVILNVFKEGWMLNK